MEIKEILSSITEELKECLENVNEDSLMDLEDKIKNSNKIFVAGAGRSLMMIRAFAMRLMHMGYTSYVVGETVTPAIEKGDLLIIASGSGNTSTLVCMAEKCKKIGANLALFTTSPDSKIGHLADTIVEVKAITIKEGGNGRKSVQQGGNTFEQSVLIIGDAIMVDLISGLSMEENDVLLMKKHANLE